MGRHRMTSSVPRQCADRSDDEGLYSYVCLTVSHKVSGDQRQTVWGHCEGCIVRLMLEERGGWSWRRLSRSWPPPGPGSRKVHATSAVRGVVHCPHVPIRLGPFLGRHRVTPRCPERQLVCSKGRMYTDESCTKSGPASECCRFLDGGGGDDQPLLDAAASSCRRTEVGALRGFFPPTRCHKVVKVVGDLGVIGRHKVGGPLSIHNLVHEEPHAWTFGHDGHQTHQSACGRPMRRARRTQQM